MIKVLKSKLLSQKGEIATALTLISVGLMLLGMVAGKVAVQQTTQTQSRAAACGPGNWVCPKTEHCASALDESNFNGTWCEGKDRWLYQDAGFNTDCNGKPSSLISAGCGSSSPASTPTPTTSAASPTSGSLGTADCPVVKSCTDLFGTDNIDPWKMTSQKGDQLYKAPGCMSGNEISEPDLENWCSISSPENTPTAAPNKQLGAGKYVVCSDTTTENGGICDSYSDGTRKFCYHECRPDKPGYSQAVWCSGANGYEVDSPVQDPNCFVPQEPQPTAGDSCSETNGQPVSGKTCTHVACDGVNWVQMGMVCYDGHQVEMPGKVLRAGDCSDQPNIPTCTGGTPAPTAALINPTKTPNQHGFHIDSQIYTYNQDNGVRFEFNVHFHFDGCDGDIELMQDGNVLGGVKGWNGPQGDYIYYPVSTNSPVLVNGQIRDVTYTGKYVNYHCSDGKNPNNMTDSFQCRLAVDNTGNPRISGTGCTWMNQGQLTPTPRLTVTPGPTGSPNANTAAPGCQKAYDCSKLSGGNSNSAYQKTDGKYYSDCSTSNSQNPWDICGITQCQFQGGTCNSKNAGNQMSSQGMGCTAPNDWCYGFSSNPPTPFPTNTPTPTLAPGYDACSKCIWDNNASIRNYNLGNQSGSQIKTIIDSWCSPPSGSQYDQQRKDCSDMKTGICKDACSAPQISPTPTPTGAPKCSSNVDDTAGIKPECSTCLIGKIGDSTLSTFTECSTDNQRINKYCTQNIPASILQCGDFIVQCKNENKCNSSNNVGNFLLPLSYNNNSYASVTQAITAGYLDALAGSVYVSAATRAPGLQIQYCDVTKHECDFNPNINTPVKT